MAIAIAGLGLLGAACERETGPASEAPAAEEETAARDEVQRRFEELEALGYAAAGDEPASGVEAETAVRVHDPEAAYAGATFFTSGHAPKAFLIDMDGRILHEWEYVLPTVVEPKRRFWRRMHLFPNGDALAIFEGRGGGIAKVDKDSNEIWALSNGAHHDLHVEADGTIYVLTRTVEVDPALDPRLPIHHDRVTKLSPEGELLEEWSIIEALRGTPWEADLVYRDGGDLLHTNTLEVLDGSHAGGHRAFRAGRFLLSFRGTNALAVLDPFLRKVVWYEKGPWNAQHQPTLLPNGNVLLLNNNSDGAVLAPGANNDWRVATAGDAGGPSEILEYDPVSREVVWRYAGTPGEKKFYTSLAGSVARLPNGNLLASLSFQGRALEVTPDGRIVWEYRTPFAIDGRVANSPEFVRLPADFPLDWARGAQVPGRSPASSK